MICIVRIRGRVGVKKKIEETLDRLRLKKKYACVVLSNPDKDQLGMVRKLRDFTAWGEIDKETLKKLIEARGKLIDKTKKLDAEKAANDIEKGKKFEEVNLKPFFRLHPPRKGINSKVHFPKGVLGNNKDKINELVERML